MMMVELTSVPSAALPVAALADYLRLSSGFADDGSQNARLEVCLRAACAAIEARTGKALFQRSFSVTFHGAWDGAEAQALPVAPVASVDAVTMIARDGAESVIEAARYGLRVDAHRPLLIATGTVLPAIPNGGSAEVEITAGFAPIWDDLPSDLQQAVLGLAAEYYNHVPAERANPMPAPIAALLAPYRPLRLGRGAMA